MKLCGWDISQQSWIISQLPSYASQGWQGFQTASLCVWNYSRIRLPAEGWHRAARPKGRRRHAPSVLESRAGLVWRVVRHVRLSAGRFFAITKQKEAM
jgi:hypothetical protein